jgi:glycosyltransferase involved in cell wall biosynthesis
VHALARSVLRLLNDHEQRRRFGGHGRARALKLFSAERCADVHLAAYELALRRARTPNASSAAADPTD